MMAMQAAQERERRHHEDMAWLAWHVAVLSRAKRMPSLNAVLGKNQTKQLTPDQVETRKAEFAELTERMAGDRK